MEIGLLFSLTGTTAITERGQCLMAEYAVHEFNRTHKKVETIIRDIASNPFKAAKEAEMLAKNGVKVFVGCYTSACRKAILPILEKYECMLVYPTLYEGMECHPNVFYTGEVPNQQVHVLIDYLSKQFGRRIYCIGTDYIYPRETNVQVKKYIKEKEGNVVGERYVPFGHKHFFEIIQDVLVKKPDGIFLTLVGSSVMAFYKTYYEMGINPVDIPIFSPITKETEIAAMKPEFTEGHYGAASYFQSLKNDENVRFIQGFKQDSNINQVISSVMYNTYLGTKLTLEATSTAKTTDFRSIFYELSCRKVETPCGFIQVEDNYRHLARPSRIGKVMKNGQFSIVWDSIKNISAKPFMEKGEVNVSLKPDLFNRWVENSEDALLLLSTNNDILGLSEKAKKLIPQDEQFTNINDLNLEKSFTLIPYTTNNQKLLFLKPKPTISINQCPSQFHIIKTINEDYKKQLEIGRIAADSKANVLILGGTGTGKEVMAKAIHLNSNRRNKPFIAVNAASIPKDLIASELFGFSEGAFTGAKRGGGTGKFEAANGGTLFLDEIGEVSHDIQVALLRVIETGKVMRIGENTERKIDVRIIAATNRNLKEEIERPGSFRADLFYRLNVLSITIPSLCERPEDIPHLSKDLLQKICETYESDTKRLSYQAEEKMKTYTWPGNIRELRNSLEHAVLMAKNSSLIDIPHLPTHISMGGKKKEGGQRSMKNNEKTLIENALKSTSTIKAASEVLGISRSTLYRKLKEYKLS